jgi:hypothetical protein
MYAKRCRRASFGIHALLTISVVCLFSGCGASPIPDSTSAARARPDQGSEMPPVRSPVTEEPYDDESFDQAQPATLPDSGEIVIEGAIDFRGDVDIYALGAAVAGDRIIVDVTGRDGLNTVAALFDADENLITQNNDRSYYGGLIDPYICAVIQADTPQLYVSIAVSIAQHFASDQGRFDTGSYSIRVRRGPGAMLRQPREQIVYLDFEGGSSVQIGLEPVVLMRPFSAESISGRLAGQTDHIVDLVVDLMRHDYAAFDLVLIDSKHGPRPTGSYTTLYFGNYNADYLGLADNADVGNVYLQQEAIIYSEDLALWEALAPSAEEVARALANIGSHELGHLVGLQHGTGAQDIMATAGSARQILEIDASFMRSPLQKDVFPVGFQDEVAVLLQNLGPSPSGSGARVRMPDASTKPLSNWRDVQGIPDIPITQRQ